MRIRPIQAIEVSAKGITPIALGDDLPPIQAFVRRAEGSIDIEGDFLSQLMNRAKRELGGGGGEEPRADMDEFPFAEFGVDLVELVRAQEQSSTEGLEREAEIEQLLQILLRYKACSPILIGEPKVGKTEVVRQLARLIARGEGLPEAFPYKHILQVSFTRLFAGAQFMGGAEATIRSLMENLRAAPDVLLFVDDLHLLRSGGRAPGGEVLDTLFAALDLSGLRLIGTATSSGYTQSLDDSSQMERVCYPVLVEPLSRERTLAVLREKSRQYEEHYGADLQPLLERVLDLSERYMPALPFPYKALELLDATGAVVLARLPERGTKTKGRKANGGTAPIYTEADVDRALSRLTSLPLERISGTNELKHLIELPHRLKASVLGQDRAVEAIARAIQRSRLGLRDSRRPIASMLFLGPTGVGKTYLAKALAREVFGREDAMVRIDMSEFSERFAVSRLIGSPPGYIGYGEGGELTEPVRTRPYCLVLLAAVGGLNVLLVLIIGIVSSGLLVFALEDVTVWDWTKALGEGIGGMGELITVTLLAGGMLELIRYNGGIDYLLEKLTRHISGKRGAELAIAALVSLANLCTANNTIAILTTGKVAREITDKYQLDPRKSASILDTFSCFIQGIIPYGAQLLLAASLTGLSPIEIIPYLYYTFIMGGMALLAILLRYPRRYS